MSSFLSSSSSSMPDNDLEMREKERCSRSSLPHVEEEFIKTTYDISLDSQISLFPDGFSLHLSAFMSRQRLRPATVREDYERN